jgi:hypothetical protein
VRIQITEVGPQGDDGEHYRYTTDIDVANADEAYVKGREFQKITFSLARGLAQQAEEEMAHGEAEDDGEG